MAQLFQLMSEEVAHPSCSGKSFECQCKMKEEKKPKGKGSNSLTTGHGVEEDNLPSKILF